jgi:hypothetical protein
MAINQLLSQKFDASIVVGGLPMNERRKKLRHRALKAGKIIFNRQLFVMDCTIRNF